MKTFRLGKFAFSLIELSIVILIIGILVIGITKGSRIIRSSKLRSAQSLTTSSPVNAIDGLLVWYESTLDKSFNSNETTEGASLSSWNNINPHLPPSNNATQGSTWPRYKENAINGLPAINFDGVDDFFSFDGSTMANTNLTIFVVEKRMATSAGLLLSAVSGNDFHVGYVTPTLLRLYIASSYQCDSAVPSTLVPRIHSVTLRTQYPARYFINGQSTTSCANSGTYTTYPTYIGRSQFGYFNGNIGEIIIFRRTLSDSERVSIESYLKQKWGIK